MILRSHAITQLGDKVELGLEIVTQSHAWQ